MKRPMLYWVTLFILGERIYKVLPVSIFGLLAIGTACAGMILLRREDRNHRLLLMLGTVFFLIGGMRMGDAQYQRQYCIEKIGQVVSFTGTVCEQEKRETEIRYVIKLQALDGRKVQAKARLCTGIGEPDYIAGSKLSGQASVCAFRHATNPGAFDEAAYQLGNGLYIQLQDGGLMQCTKPVLPVRECLYRIRRHLYTVYETVFEPPEASLAAAMVLGDKTDLDTEIKMLYQRNGIAHLIAISGLHIAMIGGSLYKGIRRCVGSYTIAAVAGGGFIVLYGIMTGLSGATFRAICMLLLMMGAEVCGRRYDGMTAIACALFLILLRNPYQMEQTGLWLSFGAVWGITLFAPVWERMVPGHPRCLNGLFVSMGVQLVLTPIVLYCYYEIPVYGIILNLIVVPLMSVLLALLIFCAVCGCLLLPVAKAAAWFANGIFFLYSLVCHISEELPFHTFCTGRPPLLWLIAYYGLMGVWLWRVEKSRHPGRWICAAIGTGLILFAMLFVPTRLQISMLDVGQGDGIYIRTPCRGHILIDGGSSSTAQVGSYVLKGGLKYYGAAKLDYVFISHSDSDHYSGVKELLQTDAVSIRNLVLPDIKNPDAEYLELVQLAKTRDCNIFYMQRGDMLQMDGIKLRCLHPQAGIYEDKNQGSLVLQLEYKQFKMLFTGDIDAPTELELVKRGDVEKVDILKAAHHGSKTSSDLRFLETIRPKITLISSGAGNQYGHPHRETLERIFSVGSEIYRTDQSGAIRICTDGYTYSTKEYIPCDRQTVK